MHTMSLKQRTSGQKCLFIQMFWTRQSLCNFSNILYTYEIVLYCCLTMAIFIFLVHQHRSRNFGNWSFTQFFLLHLTLICFDFDQSAEDKALAIWTKLMTSNLFSWIFIIYIFFIQLQYFGFWFFFCTFCMFYVGVINIYLKCWISNIL